ncbi:hypothetical protein AN958_00214 [Leucoagaricus sp. SymC.cos]|nr:hypothetical protein AN958_00214 [Leucoagaricus sp. SymC.cos]
MPLVWFVWTLLSFLCFFAAFIWSDGSKPGEQLALDLGFRVFLTLIFLGGIVNAGWMLLCRRNGVVDPRRATSI